MKTFFTHFWNKAPAVIREKQLDGRSPFENSRRLKTFLVKAVNENKAAIVIHPVISKLSIPRLAKALRTTGVIVIPGESINNIFKYSMKGVAMLGALRNIPIIVDVGIIHFTTILVDADRKGFLFEIDPICFIRLLNGKFYHIATTVPPNKTSFFNL